MKKKTVRIILIVVIAAVVVFGAFVCYRYYQSNNPGKPALNIHVMVDDEIYFSTGEVIAFNDEQAKAFHEVGTITSAVSNTKGVTKNFQVNRTGYMGKKLYQSDDKSYVYVLWTYEETPYNSLYKKGDTVYLKFISKSASDKYFESISGGNKDSKS